MGEYLLSSPIFHLQGDDSKPRVTVREILISIFIIFVFGLLFNLWYKLIFELSFEHIQNRKTKISVISVATIVMTIIALIIIYLVSRNFLGKKTTEAVLNVCGKKDKLKKKAA
jgi:hypothetical protein